MHSNVGESIFFDNVLKYNLITSNLSAVQGGGAITSEGSVLAIVPNFFKSHSLSPLINTFDSNTSSADMKQFILIE